MKKTLLHTLLLLVFKITESLQCNLNNFMSFHKSLLFYYMIGYFKTSNQITTSLMITLTFFSNTKQNTDPLSFVEIFFGTLPLKWPSSNQAYLPYKVFLSFLHFPFCLCSNRYNCYAGVYPSTLPDLNFCT